MRARLTVRGWVVVAVILVAAAMSWKFGPRALNAVVVPLSVVLAGGLVTVVRADRPRVDRRPVSDGFIGERRRVEVAIESELPVAATVRDAVGDGLSAAAEPIAETTLEGDETISYDVRLEGRGDRRVGPLTITISDVLGLAERRFEYERTTSVLVYPYVRDLGRGHAADLETIVGVAHRRDHDEFDHLREYRRGDPLRDVHWKSVAKRQDDELTVTEYADADAAGSVTVAAECLPGQPDGRPDREDEMAVATASVATYLLERGASVGITVPDGTRPPGTGRTHHRELLGLLAVAEPGELPERARRNADVLIRTDGDGTTVAVDDREIPFGRLGDPADRGGTEGTRRAGTGSDGDEERAIGRSSGASA